MPRNSLVLLPCLALGACTLIGPSGTDADSIPDCLFDGNVEGAVQGGLSLTTPTCQGLSVGAFEGGSIIEDTYWVDVLLENSLILDAGATFSNVDARLGLTDRQAEDVWEVSPDAPCAADVDEIVDVEDGLLVRTYVSGTIQCASPLVGRAGNSTEEDVMLSGTGTFRFEAF